MEKLVEFIIPTYNRKEPLASMLASLLAQTNTSWKVHILVDDPSYEEPSYYKEFLHYSSYKERQIKVTIMTQRYNDWGHTPREIGKQESDAQYIIMTGDDNYYTPNFVEELSKAATSNPGMIYWDMVHSHYDYHYFKCFPAFNQIDMGAFATRRDLAQSIKLNTTYAADGEYVRDFNNLYPGESKVYIPKVLFVHN